jgi:hypothetical protein
MEFQERETLEMAIKTMPLLEIKSEELTSAQAPVARDQLGALNRTMQMNERINFFNFDHTSYDLANVGSSSLTEQTQMGAVGTGDAL